MVDQPFDELRAGPFVVTSDGTEARDGQTPGRVDSSGLAYRYRASDRDDADLLLSYVVWNNGERHVELTTKTRGPEELNSLEGRLRLTIQREGDVEYCELKQARLKVDRSRMRPTWRKATVEELDDGANLNVADVLTAAGATAVGTREDLLEDDGRHRSSLCATFPPGDHASPVTAFVVTRVLPLMNGLRA